MSERKCRFEEAVVAAVRSGEWSESLRAHASECSHCAETERVTAWMGDLAVELGRDEGAPDPTYILLKSEIEKSERDAARVSRRGLIVQTVLNLVLALAGAAALLSIWPEVSATVSEARASVQTMLAQASAADITAAGSIWLGLPLLFVLIYIFYRPLR